MSRGVERFYEYLDQIEFKYLTRTPRSVGSITIKEVIPGVEFYPGSTTVILPLRYDRNHFDYSVYILGCNPPLKAGQRVEVIVAESNLSSVSLPPEKSCYVAIRPYENTKVGTITDVDLNSLKAMFLKNHKFEGSNKAFYSRFLNG